ncbi:MAG: hypothetical protein AAFU79_28530 [Myxococcota bacterium]
MPICDMCTRWQGQEAVSISSMKAEMADRHRRGERMGAGHDGDLFLFPYAQMANDFSPSDYALFDSGAEALDFDAHEGDWEGS